MSPDMNLIEHVWDFIGRKNNQRNPKCQNIDELTTAILQEWQQFPKNGRKTSLSLMEVFNIALKCRVFRF
jgi:transposase